MIRNMQIRSKLIAILVIPLVALTVLAAIAIAANVARGVQADRVKDQTAFAVKLSELVHQLQRERDLSAGWVGSGRDAGYGAVVAQRVAVNQALDDFRRDLEGLTFEDDEATLRRNVETAVNSLDRLGEQRSGIENAPDTTVPGTLDYYSNLIGNLLTVNREIARQTDDRALARNLETFVSLGRFKEAASQERGLVHAVASVGQFAPGEFQRFATSLGAQNTWRTQFDATATPSQRDALAQALASNDVLQANELRNYLRNALLTSDARSKVDLDPKAWYRSTTAGIDLLRGVENEVAADVTAAGQAAQSSASRQALLYTVVLTLVLWLTIGLSLLLARSLVGPLRTLTRTANDVAEERLPGLVDRLQQAKDPRQLDVVPEPVPVTSNDEVGQVSAAFNKVHKVATQVATDQAALRRSIGDMFLNLARRSQTLIDRQLELIDDLERTEADPDALANLFKLDHLATRMRRNAEDLIVLSGAEPARRWSQPIPLVEVVRGALGEVEDYNRVELLPIDDVGVAGQAVSDVVHLLAELLENATTFSPPGTKVQVAGQPISNGYVLEIEDRGLGMSDEELIEANERLANPPMVDFALSRMLGLYVVARLAQRYGIKVQLRHSWYGGITALVLLPPNLIVQAPKPEQLEAPARRGGRPELVASSQPVEPAAEPTGEHLPIFEAARSDWFEDGAHGDHLPLRRHAAQSPGDRAAQPTGNGAGPGGLPTDRRLQPDQAEAAREQPARAEATPVEAGAGAESAQAEAETARAEAGPAEAAPAEAAAGAAGTVEGREPAAAETHEPAAAGTSASGPAGAGAAEEQTPPATARTDRPRPSAARPRTGTGPLPTRTPGAAAPPPGGHQPFAPAAGRRRADRAASQPPPPPRADVPAAPKLQDASVQTTKAGLPRRVPRANLAPGIVASKAATPAAAPTRPASAAPPASPSASRSPEEVRSMLSSYRSGLERGRIMAAGEDAGGGDAHSSSRSDDDATQ
jgi:hypothetical protein